MTNWLVVLILVLPILFSRITLDPVISVRYTLLAGFVFLFVAYFFLVRKRLPGLPSYRLINAVFLSGLAFCIWSIIPTLKAINIQEGNYETARQFLNIILLVIVTLTIQHENRVLQLCKAILVVSIIQSFVGIMQHYEVAFTNLPGTVPPFGLMANRNLFGSAQTLVLPFAVFVLYKASGIWKYLSMLAIAGITVSVLVSQTRSAWLASVVVFMILLLLALMFSANKKRWLVNMGIAIAAVVLLVALVLATGKEGGFAGLIRERASSLTETSPQASTTSTIGSAQERLGIWRATSSLIKDHALVGVGPGNWKLEVIRYDTAGKVWPTGAVLPTRPHNVYLQVLSETGIPGAILYFGMWTIVVVIAFKVIRKCGDEDKRILTILMLAGLAGFATDAMFSFPTERIEHSVYIFLMAGILLGTYAGLNAAGAKTPTPVSKRLIVVPLLLAAYNIFIGFKKYSFEVHMNYAKAYENNKNYQEELAEVEAGKNAFVTIDPLGVPLEVRSSIAYKELKDYNNALIEINKAKQINPNSSMIYNNAGTIYTETRAFDKAIENYLEALKLSPQMGAALKNLALNYFQVGNYAACIDALNKVEATGEDKVFLESMVNEARKRMQFQSPSK